MSTEGDSSLPNWQSRLNDDEVEYGFDLFARHVELLNDLYDWICGPES